VSRSACSFIAGTDAGLPGSVFDNFAGALGLYSWLGFPNDRIIEFATVNAASVLRLAAVTGQLVPGLAADLLVVEGDPLTTLDALHKVRMVMTSGRSTITLLLTATSCLLVVTMRWNRRRALAGEAHTYPFSLAKRPKD
jgi:imidazolonepropionase-like amidohydrolase